MVTANHCVEGSTKLIIVYEGKIVEAKVVITDKDDDSAIIRTGLKGTPYLELGLMPNTDNVVHILGFPIPEFRGYDLKIKDGESVRQDSNGDYLLAAGSCQGNSGGPVVNSSNLAIGILTAGWGAPCSYYSFAETIVSVINMALVEGVPITVPLFLLNTRYTKADIFKQDQSAVKLLFGE